MQLGDCCDSQADCDDGDPCTLDSCTTASPRHCVHLSAWPGCCTAEHVERCLGQPNPCLSGACNSNAYTEVLQGWTTTGPDAADPPSERFFGGCAMVPCCCTHEVNCNDLNPTTLDLCNLDLHSCVFVPPAQWCPDPNGPCAGLGAGLHVVSPPGVELTRVVSCQADPSLCATWWLSLYCSVPGNCVVGEADAACCRSDADCDDQDAGTLDECVAAECVVRDSLGIPVSPEEGRCQHTPGGGLCRTAVDCATSPVSQCEMVDGVPVCHSPQTSGVSVAWHCGPGNLCATQDKLCQEDLDCTTSTSCLAGTCIRQEGQVSGKCVFLPAGWSAPDVVTPTVRQCIQADCITTPGMCHLQPVPCEEPCQEDWIEFETDHFSSFDINLPAPPPPGSSGGAGGGSGSGGGSGIGGGGGGGSGGNGNGGGLGGEPDDKQPNEPECQEDSGGSSIGRATGNLRLGVDLPHVIWSGRKVGPTLQYDSATAAPTVYLGARMDLSNIEVAWFPQRLRLDWSFAGRTGNAYYSASFSQEEYTPGVLVDAIDIEGQPLGTGLHPSMVTVAAEYNPFYYLATRFGGPPTDATDRRARETVWVGQSFVDLVPVVDRSTSPFGAGWSLDGLMELRTDPVTGDHLVVEGSAAYPIHNLGHLHRFAGDGSTNSVSSGDGGPAVKATFKTPGYVEADKNGNVYVVEDYRIRRISASGLIETVAGCGTTDECTDVYGSDWCNPSQQDDCAGWPATHVQLAKLTLTGWTSPVRISSSGEVYFVQKGDADPNPVPQPHLVRKVDTGGILQTLAGGIYLISNEGGVKCLGAQPPAIPCNSLAVWLPMSLEIQEGPGGVTVLYANLAPPGNACEGNVPPNECFVVRRLLPNGTFDSLFGSSAGGLRLPRDMRVVAPGQLLVAQYGRMKVSFIEFGDGTPSQPNEPEIQDFAGNGEAPAGLAPQGGAKGTPIGKPEALTLGPEGNVYVSCAGSNLPDLALRIATQTSQGLVDSTVLSTVGGMPALPDPVPLPVEGLEATKVVLTNIAGVAWNPVGGALLVGVEYSGDIWEVSQLPQYPDRRFTELAPRTPTADPTAWILDERNGMQHRFDEVGKHLRSLDRWGNERSYGYDAQGNLTTVIWPGGSQTVFGYADNHVESASLVPAGGGNGPVVTFDIDGAGDLVSLDSGTDFKRQFEYDDQHRLTARYHGDAVALPALLDRYVEYTYENGMVSGVTFHDTDAEGQPVPEVINRVYTHSREHGLFDPENPGVGSPENPIPIALDTGWDSVVDAAGIETLTRLDPQGRTLEIRRITGVKTAWTVYDRNASGFITRMCHRGSETSPPCDYEETYDYDDLGNLTTVTVHDPDSTESSEWKYFYSVQERTVADHDVTFTLSAMVVNPENELLKRVYDAYGNLTELQLATDWQYDADKVPVVLSSNRALWSYGGFLHYGLPFKAYDAACTASPSGPEGCATVFTYDGKRNLTKVDPADPSWTELTRDPARGWVTQVKEPVLSGPAPGTLAPATWTIGRDVWGRPTALSGPGTGTTNLAWTDPLTGSGCASCSAGDKLSEVVGPAPGGGQTARPLTKYAYDLAGRLLRTQTGYRVAEPNPNDEFVRSVLYIRDPTGRAIGMQVEDTQTEMSAVYGENSGQLESLSVSLGTDPPLQWAYQHDLLDRPSPVIAPDGGQWEYDYDYLSGVTQVKETGTSRTTRFERDGVGRITRRILDDGVTQTPEVDPVWAYTYDAVGQFVKLEDPTETPDNPEDGFGTTLQRNAAGQVTKIRRDGALVDNSIQDPYNRTTQVSRTTDGLETRYDFTYNTASALYSMNASWHTGTPATETLALEHRYIYDSAGRPETVEARHDTPGHWADGPQLSATYGYDNAGRLDEVAVQVPSTPPGTSLQGRVALARDSAGRLERMDFLSRDVEDSNGNGNTLEYVVRKRTAVSYEPFSSRLKMLRTGVPGDNNAVTTPFLVDLTYSYDPAGRITAQETATPEDPTWWKRTYSYDPASRLTEAKDYFPSSENPLPWLNRWAWTYNTAGERTSQTVLVDLPPSGDPPQNPAPETQLSEGYSWDAYGVLDKTYPAGNEAGTRDDFTFDDAGNLQTLAQVDGTTLSFAHDPSGRTKTVTIGGTGLHSDGTVVTYRYGPDERLTERTVDLLGNSTIDSVTRYFSDGLISWEIDGITGGFLRAYVLLPDGFTPLFIVTFDDPPPTTPPDPPAAQPGTIYFVHNDHLSTPKAVTDLAGEPVWLARHAPFGQVEELCGANGTLDPNGPAAPGPCAFQQPLRFPGQWDQSDAHDVLAGVWYNWHRFYLPQWGIYSRRDPIAVASPTRAVANAFGHFGYAAASPSSVVDPTGLINNFDYGDAEYWNRRAQNEGSPFGDSGFGDVLEALAALALSPLALLGGCRPGQRLSDQAVDNLQNLHFWTPFDICAHGKSLTEMQEQCPQQAHDSCLATCSLPGLNVPCETMCDFPRTGAVGDEGYQHWQQVNEQDEGQE